MDDYDFTKQDREKLRQIEEVERARMSDYEWYYDRWISIYSLPPLPLPPNPFELIAIGEYDGDDLLPGVAVLDDSYIIYLEIENPEHNCEVIHEN